MAKKHKPIWSEARWKLFKQNTRFKIENHLNERYIEQTRQGVDQAAYVRQFNKISRDLRGDFLQRSIESLAVVDSGEKVNDLLYDLGLENAELDTNELRNLSLIILRMKIFTVLVEHSNLDRKIGEKLINRFIERLLPLRNYSEEKKRSGKSRTA